MGALVVHGVPGLLDPALGNDGAIVDPIL